MLAVCLTSDQLYAGQLGVAIASIALAHREGGIAVHVLDCGMTAPQRERVRICARHLPIEFHPQRFGDSLPLSLGTYPAATLARLFLSELLVGERALYLDSDMLVLTDLRPLDAVDLGGRPLAAVRDGWIGWIGHRRSGLPWRSIGLAPSLPYFNSGLLLMDLEAWRSRDVSRRAVEFLRAHTVPHADQSALNCVLADDWLELAPVWNAQNEFFLPEPELMSVWGPAPSYDQGHGHGPPLVVHYLNGPLGRPWESDCRHPLRDRWLAMVDETPWRGWRPERLRHSPLARARARGARILLGSSPPRPLAPRDRSFGT